MEHSNEEDQKTLSRLNRANGQVTAIGKMIEDGRDCADVIVQFKAAKSAIESAYASFLRSRLSTCLVKKDKETMEHIIDSLTKQ